MRSVSFFLCWLYLMSKPVRSLHHWPQCGWGWSCGNQGEFVRSLMGVIKDELSRFHPGMILPVHVGVAAKIFCVILAKVAVIGTCYLVCLEVKRAKLSASQLFCWITGLISVALHFFLALSFHLQPKAFPKIVICIHLCPLYTHANTHRSKSLVLQLINN